MMAYLTPAVCFLCTLFALLAAEMQLTPGKPYKCQNLAQNLTDSVDGVVANLTGISTQLIDYSKAFVIKKGATECVVAGNFTLLQPVNNQFTVSIELYRIDNSAAGQFSLTRNQNICGNLKNANNVFMKIFSDIFGDVTPSCPLAKGNYTAQGQGLSQSYVSNITDSNFKYAFEVTLKSGLHATCIRFDALVVKQ